MSKRTIVLHATAPLNMLRPLLSVCEEYGLRVRRTDYEIESIKTPDELHWIWGMRYRPPVYEELARLPNVYFVENGWFTQRDGCYIDKNGPNGLSSIRNSVSNEPLTREEDDEVTQFVAKLHRRVQLRPVKGQGEYLFVPLQVEKDTQLLFWSGCNASYPDRQVWFIDHVCRAFPDTKIIIRPHPRDRGVVTRLKRRCTALRRHRNVFFRSDRSSYDWIAGARAVLGINSTVLLEALTFCKPVCAMGTGVFTGNRTMLECQGDPGVLQKLPEFEHDVPGIRKFLHHLISRQIPYQLDAADASQYPVLWEVIRDSPGQSIPQPSSCRGGQPRVARPP